MQTKRLTKEKLLTFETTLLNLRYLEVTLPLFSSMACLARGNSKVIACIGPPKFQVLSKSLNPNQNVNIPTYISTRNNSLRLPFSSMCKDNILIL